MSERWRTCARLSGWSRGFIRCLKTFPRRLRHIDGAHGNRLHFLSRGSIELPAFKCDRSHRKHYTRAVNGRKRWHRISPTGESQKMRNTARGSYWPRFPARNGGFAYRGRAFLGLSRSTAVSLVYACQRPGSDLPRPQRHDARFPGSRRSHARLLERALFKPSQPTRIRPPRPPNPGRRS